jgi:hypothetical protein
LAVSKALIQSSEAFDLEKLREIGVYTLWEGRKNIVFSN